MFSVNIKTSGEALFFCGYLSKTAARGGVRTSITNKTIGKGAPCDVKLRQATIMRLRENTTDREIMAGKS